jgi:CTP:molybdopterin cytidylyltransferase MocA
VARVAGAVLAAGAGVRMGQPKAELVVHGRRLVDRAVDALSQAGCRPVLAVVRAGVEVPGTRTLVNPDPSRGMRSSLALAVEAVEAAEDVDALAVLLVDLPGIDARAIAATAGAWRAGRIAVATYAGRRGHPIVMAPSLWRAALELADADEGARRLLLAHPELVDQVAVAGDPADVDTPAELASWQARDR